MFENNSDQLYIVTAGPTYLDIDAYACAVSLAELMRLKGKNAVAYSKATCNYSVCRSLIVEGQIQRELPDGFAEKAKYIIVDVSDSDFLKDSIPLDRVVEIYDHHIGFETYWKSRIGSGSHIEFIGCAATLIYREWKKSGLQNKISRSTALLMIAAILDNTLNLTSSNTTDEDREVFQLLCDQAGVDNTFRAEYFSEVQSNVEADLKNALMNDMKRIGDNPVLPANIAQICVWDADGMLEKLSDIRRWLADMAGGWMLNLIDIKHHSGYFVCDDIQRQSKIEQIFDVHFHNGIAKLSKPYLRKQVLKNVLNSM